MQAAPRHLDCYVDSVHGEPAAHLGLKQGQGLAFQWLKGGVREGLNLGEVRVRLHGREGDHLESHPACS